MTAATAHLTAEIAWLAARRLAPLELEPPWSHGGAGIHAEPQVAILETVRTRAITAAGDSEGYFRWCGEPLTTQLVDQAISHLHAGREALWSLVAERGDGWLDARPKPGKRSTRETLHHLADAELFYLVRLASSQAEARENWAAWSGRGQTEKARLDAIRQRLIDALRSLPGRSAARVTVHDPHAERWSPLKVAYRAIWHERYTTRLL